MDYLTNLVVERWSSNENQMEVHLFAKGAQNMYVFGFNPALVKEHLVREFLKGQGYTYPELLFDEEED